MGLKINFFSKFFVQNFFLKFFKFSRHADLKGFGVAACEIVPAWRRPAAACITEYKLRNYRNNFNDWSIVYWPHDRQVEVLLLLSALQVTSEKSNKTLTCK